MMSNRTKMWLISAAALVLVGCIIFGGAMMSLKWEFGKLSTVKYETNEYAIDKDFKSISVITDTADIKFAVSKNTDASVVCREQNNMRHSVYVKEGTLTIELTDTRKWYEYIGINFGTTEITVYLPEGQYEALYIKESTGDIEIPDAFTFESIDITASTGDIENYASAAERIKIKTSTGDIRVEGVSAGSLELAVSTGRIAISTVSCEGDIKLTVTTGKSSLTDVTCKNLTSAGSTGKLTLKNVVAEETLRIDRSTGDVTFDSCDAGTISVKTDTGDVSGTLRTPKSFYTSTDTGKVRVPKTSGGICEITTSTGDIEIDC